MRRNQELEPWTIWTMLERSQICRAETLVVHMGIPLLRLSLVLRIAILVEQCLAHPLQVLELVVRN